MSSESSSKNGSAARAAMQKLESLQRAGVTHLAKSREPVATTPVSKNKPAEAKAAEAATPAPSGDPETALAEARTTVAACTRCSELASKRTQTVFGEGNPRARLVFLGEAPGADEDREGRPFVGRAGKLLDKIIEAMNLTRQEVYILNILKCRPPGNRNPEPAEATACREHLDRQLAIIQPEFICCLGTIAAQNLLDTTTPIGRLRGSFHDYQGIKVICTYHPAYLLRNPSAKRQVWDDMQVLMAQMN